MRIPGKRVPRTRLIRTHNSERESQMLELLLRGEKEIEAGKGYDIDAVLAEADTLLKEMQDQGN